MKSLKILVVDDDAMIRDLVKSMLEAEGHTVVTAEDGLVGIDYLDKLPRPVDINLVVMDVCMPNMNGLDVVTRMKLHPHTQTLPVLMLTGEDQAEDILSGYSSGADYYITKPFTRQQLLFGVQMITDGES